MIVIKGSTIIVSKQFKKSSTIMVPKIFLMMMLKSFLMMILKKFLNADTKKVL